MKEIEFRPKDLDKWLRRDALDVHAHLQVHWDTDIGPPHTSITMKMTTGYDTTDDSQGKVIRFNFSQMSKLISKYIEHGICETPGQGLTVIYGEEDTHYINDCLVPNLSLECRELLERSFMEKNGQKLLRQINIMSQMEGIGRIGSAEAVLRLYPRYDADKEASLTVGREQRSSARVTDKINRIMDQHPLYAKPMATVSDVPKLLIEIYCFLTAQIGSYAGYEVSKMFRKEFDGRMGELIRRKLEYDPSLDPIVRKTMDMLGSGVLYRRLGIGFS